MRNLMTGLAAMALWLALACAVQAQPALERLEKDVARQVAPPQPESNETAADKPDEPGFLGIIADDRNENGRGVRVLDVDVGGPAAGAGLKRGDLITEVDGRAVTSMQHFAERLEKTPAGGKLSLRIERDGKLQPLEVTLGRRPPVVRRRFPEFGRIPDPPGRPTLPPDKLPPDKQTPKKPKPGLLGVWVEEVTSDRQAELGLPGAQGALVTRVSEGSPAERIGLAPDDVILAVDGERVDAKDDLKRLLTAAGPGADVRLAWYSGGDFVEHSVRLRGAKPPDGDSSAPAAAPPAADATAESERIRALERRMRELERRLAELERLLTEPAPDERRPAK